MKRPIVGYTATVFSTATGVPGYPGLVDTGRVIPSQPILLGQGPGGNLPVGIASTAPASPRSTLIHAAAHPSANVD